MNFSQITEADFIENVTRINWKQFNGPEYYRPDEIITSLTNLINLRSEDEKWNIYSDVLSAIGNDHAGTYYPVIIDILPLIIGLLKSSRYEPVRNCILEILSEWYYSFGPELGTFTTSNEKDLEDFVRGNIKQFITETKWNDSDRNMKLISDFNDYFAEEASAY